MPESGSRTQTTPTRARLTPLGKQGLAVIFPVIVVVSLDAASAGATLPILPFLLLDFGASPVIVGTVIGAEALSLFIAAPFLGQLSDRFGRKTILLASQAGALLSLSLLLMAESVAVVLLARIVLGFTAANFITAAAYVADNSSHTTRRHALGLLSAGLGLGGIIGPALSSYLSTIALTASIQAAFVLTALSLAVTTLFVKQKSPSAEPTCNENDKRQEAVSFRSIATSPVIRILVLVLLCHYFAYSIFTSQLPVFLSETFTWNGQAFGPKEFGYILTADGVINILVQVFLLGWLGQFFGERGLIVLLFCILAMGYIGAGIAQGIPMLAFAVLCVSTGVALARPTFMAALSVHVAKERQGVVMGTMQALVSMTDVVAPVIAGLILGLGLYHLWIGTTVAIVAGGVLLAARRLPKVDPETLLDKRHGSASDDIPVDAHADRDVHDRHY